MKSARPLSPELIPSATELLAHAFYTNPVHVYICPDPDKRFDQLCWLLGGNLRATLRDDFGASFCLVDAGVVQAMGYWTRPNPPPIGTSAKIRAGLLAAPMRLGLGGVRRLSEVTARIEDSRARALGDVPYWFLNNMVVREELRGTGVGTRLLGEQLRILSGHESSATVGLATQRAENVTFYRRLGFEVADEQMIGQGVNSFQNWIMVLGEVLPGAAGHRPA